MNSFNNRLKRAVREGDVKVVKRILKGGIDPSAKSWYKSTLLHDAILEGRTEIALLLICAGCPVDSPNEGGRTSIHLAARAGNGEVVRALIAAKCDLNRKTQDNRTSLHIAAWRGRTEIVKYLLEAGANVNVRDEDGWMPLHWAARLNYLEIAKLLVHHGAMVDSQIPKSCKTPLTESIDKGHVDLIKYLVTEGAVEMMKEEEQAVYVEKILGSKDFNIQNKMDIMDLSSLHGLDRNCLISILESDKFKKLTNSNFIFSTWMANLYQVCSLQEMCRKVIRKCLLQKSHCSQIQRSASKLNLPKLLEDYICFRIK